jgi:DNA-directed RNA polymerase subunit M/transcription elongation factor TFIIS
MIVFCEECGERYIIEKYMIKEKIIVFNCKKCKYLIEIATSSSNVAIPAEGKKPKS